MKVFQAIRIHQRWQLDANGAHERPLLECPRCRHLVEGANGRSGIQRCHACGSRLIPSTQGTEAAARKRLYGRATQIRRMPPVREPADEAGVQEAS